MIGTLSKLRGRRRRGDVRGVHRPRRVPAGVRQRLPDDDAARRRRPAGVHARAGGGAARHPARARAGLHRPEGRHRRRHQGRAGDRRQDGLGAAPAVRVDRRHLRAHRRGGRPEAAAGADRPRASRCASRPTSARSGATSRARRPRPRRGRGRLARPLGAEGSAPAVGVPRPDGRLDELEEAVASVPRDPTGPTVPWREVSPEEPTGRSRAPRWRGLAGNGERTAVALEAETLIVDGRPARWRRSSPMAPRRRRARREGAAARVPAGRRAGRVRHRSWRAYLIEPNRTAYTVEAMLDDAAIEPQVQADEDTARLIRSAYGSLALRPWLAGRLEERNGTRLLADVELPLVTVLAAMEDAGMRVDPYHLAEIAAASPTRSRSSSSRPTTWRAARSRSARRSSSARCCSSGSGCPPTARARRATRPTSACCRRSATCTRSWRWSSAGAS